jgi:hypothetical protein
MLLKAQNNFFEKKQEIGVRNQDKTENVFLSLDSNILTLNNGEARSFAIIF